MSQPRTRADRLDVVVPGVLHWTIHDERIGFRSEAYAVESPGGLVLIDPLPVDESIAPRLEGARAICLTGAFHQRAAWSYRRRAGIPVLAPRDAAGLDEQPDRWFDDGDEPVEGLTALLRPGPSQPHFVFHRRTPDGLSVVFCADLLMRGEEGSFAFVPDDHQDDPQLSRLSVGRLQELSVDVLCPAHGAPAVADASRLLREALEADAS